jgi:hypothetical protein
MANEPSPAPIRRKVRALLLGGRIRYLGARADRCPLDRAACIPCQAVTAWSRYFVWGRGHGISYGVIVLVNLSVLEEDEVLRGLHIRSSAGEIDRAAMNAAATRQRRAGSRAGGSGNESKQEVSVAPDAGTHDAGQITEVREDLVGYRRFQAKLDFSGHRYEAFFERRRESMLIEIDEPERDGGSDQSHDRP